MGFRPMHFIHRKHKQDRVKKKESVVIAACRSANYSQIHPALQQIPAHSTLELCL